MTNPIPFPDPRTATGDQSLLVGGLWGSTQPVQPDPQIPCRGWSADQHADLPGVILGHD